MSGYPEKTADEWAEEKRQQERFAEMDRQVIEQDKKQAKKAKAARAYEKSMRKVLKILRLPEDFTYKPNHPATSDVQGLGNRMNEARQELLCTLDAQGAFD